MNETFGWCDFKEGDLVKSDGKIFTVLSRDPDNTANILVSDADGAVWVVHNCLCDLLVN